VRVSPSNQPTAVASGQKAVNPAQASSASTSTQATVDFIDSNINTGSGTMAVRAAVPNQDRTFWPGQAVKVEIDLGTHSDVVLVPTVAVQPGQTGSNVFVVKPDQTIDVRPVELACIVGDRAGIVSGLRAGETVVTEGQLSLASGMKVTVRAAKPVPVEKGAPVGKDGAGGAITKGDAPAAISGSEAKL
jgi:multidrug efflux system membrane fusion protein